MRPPRDTPLIDAVRTLALERGGAIDHQDGEGMTGLMCAATMGHEEIVRLLLARGANPHLEDRAGRTALDHALIREQPAIAKLLED